MSTITPSTTGDSLLGRIFKSSHLTELFDTAGWIFELLYAVIVMAAMAAVIINITKLARSAGNPVERSRALTGILVSGACLSLLGSLGLIFIVLVGFI